MSVSEKQLVKGFMYKKYTYFGIYERREFQESLVNH